MDKKIITGLVVSSVIVQAILFSLLYRFVQVLSTLWFEGCFWGLLLGTPSKNSLASEDGEEYKNGCSK